LSSSGDEDATLNACLGRPPTAPHGTAQTFSPNFSAGDNRQVLGGTTVVDDAATAQAGLAALADATRAGPCHQ
jgi:hypothetical protein